MRLLAGAGPGTPAAQRVVAAYVVGWPVSVTADLPALALPACERPDEAACVSPGRASPSRPTRAR